MNLSILAALASLFMPSQKLPGLASILGQGDSSIYSQPYGYEPDPYTYDHEPYYGNSRNVGVGDILAGGGLDGIFGGGGSGGGIEDILMNGGLEGVLGGGGGEILGGRGNGGGGIEDILMNGGLEGVLGGGGMDGILGGGGGGNDWGQLLVQFPILLPQIGVGG